MSNKRKKRSKKRTPEAVENNLISLAMKTAEDRLKDGTASSQIVTELMKRGSTKERLKEEMIEEKKKLVAAKVEAMESAKRVEELYEEAMDAFKSYSGNT